MDTLSEISSKANFATPEAATGALRYAERFTARFCEVEGLDPATREAAMQRVQVPQLFRGPEPGDLFAGRVLYPVVGFSPEPCGLGYYFDFAAVAAWAGGGRCAPDEAERWNAVAEFWRGRTTAAKCRAAYPQEVAEALPSDAWTEESGVAFPLYRFAGTVLDYATLLDLGLDGLESRVLAGEAGDPAFRRACAEVIGLVRETADAYAARCSDPEMAAVLGAIRHGPPQTFRQAIQLLWLWALHAGTWNYGRLDVILGPFLAADLDSGVLGEAEALELLCGFWRLTHAYANQYNNRIIIGGKGRPDEEAADRFALLAIEATRRVRLNQPQLTLRFYRGQNPLLWERALDAIGEGRTFPMLYNDDANVPAVAAAFGVDEALAEQYTPFGCGEYVLGHHSVGTPSGVINLLKALEIALHGGRDPLTGRPVVAGIPGAARLGSFEDVWDAYARVVEAHVKPLAAQQRIEYRVSGSEGAFLFISMLHSTCLERGKPVLSGGASHLGGTLETYGNTNAADSLHAIEELVFRRGEVRLPELVEAMDRDFAGREDLRRKCAAVAKYGNDEAASDAIARRVHRHICSVTRESAAAAGLDSYLVVVINNWANTVLGWRTGASADGRRAGQPMANGNNPAPGADTSGVTAFLNSLARLDPDMHAGAVQNMKFTRDWFGGMRPKFDALLRGYFAQGGTQAMITVVSREDLEEAMREPEKWGHLMVRVGGFSIRFVELPTEAQREVLGRTLH